MTTFTLVSYNQCDYPYEVYPLGMAVVASALKNAGYTVYQYDCLRQGSDEQSIAEFVRSSQTDFLGFSIRNLDDDIDSSLKLDNQLKIRQLRNMIKACRTVKPLTVILGGPAFSLMPEVFLKLSQADYGIVGEGETALLELVDNVLAGRSSEPIRFARCSQNNNHVSARGEYPAELVSYYYQKSGVMNVQTKRGCPFHCSYCTYPVLEGNRFRFRDPLDVVEDIDRLKTDFGCENFFFTDSVFNDPAGKYREFLDCLIRRDLDIKWSAYFTPYGLSTDDISLCQKAGVTSIELGTDGTSDSTLAGLNKIFSWSDVVKANERITKAGIPCAHFVIFGGPGETYQTVAEGIANCRNMPGCIVFGSTGIRIYPGTEIRKMAVRENMMDPDVNLLEPIFYFSTGLDQSRVDRMIKQGWQKQHRLIYPPSRSRAIINGLKQICGMKGILWDKMLTMGWE